ncbi:hypothetical protein ACVME8_010795 [Bradyrhizobium diazoefficiens]
MRTPRKDLGHENETQSFVIRVRVDPVGAGNAVPRLRIEHVNKRTVWQFTDIGAALAQLKISLDAIVLGSAA